MSELTAVRTATSRAAWVAGLGVLGYFVAREAISAFVTTVEASAMMGYGVVDEGRWIHVGLSIATIGVPFAVAAALSFSRIARIHADLRLAQVIGRGLIAAALGAVLVLTVQVVASLVISPPTSSAISGLLDADGFASFFRVALSHVVMFAIHAPLLVLAAVLLWLGLRRDVTAASD